MVSQVFMHLLFAVIAVFSGFIGSAVAQDDEVYGTAVTAGVYSNRVGNHHETIRHHDVIRDVDHAALHEEYEYGVVKKFADLHGEYGHPRNHGTYGQGPRYNVGAPMTRNR